MKNFQTIYLSASEDIAALVEHLNQAAAENIILVIPQNAEIFSSIINLRLLRREAERLQKKVFIATEDKIGRHLAEKAEIAIIDELEEGTFLVEEKRPTAQKIKEKHILDKEGFKAVEHTAKPVPPRLMADIVAPSKAVYRPKIEEQEEKQITTAPDIAIKDDLKEDVVRVYQPPEQVEPISQLPIKSYLSEESPQPAVSQSEIILHPHIEEYPVRQTLLEKFWPAKRKITTVKEKKLLSSKILKRLFAVFVFLGIAVAFFALYIILPEAKLIITPKNESVSLDVAVLADKNISQIDYTLRRIPAQIIKIEKKETKEFTASGERTLDEKARGIITVFNEFSSSPQTLVQNTRFVSVETGKLFRTVKTITVPGAKIENSKVVANSIDVEVVADQPGPDYNIGPSKFNIPGFLGSPKYKGFYGKSKEAMSGGSLGKTKIVFQADLDNARTTLLNEIGSKAKEDLKSQLLDNLVLLEDAVKQEEPEIIFSAKAGSPAEKFTTTIIFRNTAVAFEKKHINELIDRVILSTSGLQKELLTNTRELNYDRWQVNFDKGQINIELKVKQNLIWKIDEEELRKRLINKDETEIRKILSQMPQIQNAKVTFWPFWIKKIPSQMDKIKIIIQKEEDTID